MNNTDVKWERKQFKKNKVWLMVDGDNNPIVKDKKVLIKYNLKQDYEYWVHQNSVTEIDPKQLMRKQGGKKKARKKNNPAAKTVAMQAETEAPNAVIIYTDGASSGNPGSAGIGVVLRHGNNEKEISKSIGRATNNVAELEAIRVGLAAIKHIHLPVRVFTDSAYALGVLSLGWKAKKNTELIRSIKRLMDRFEDIQLIKVPGHSGVPENERADALAVAGIMADT